MLEASLQTINSLADDARFSLLSIYPVHDAQRNHYSNLDILKATPVYLALNISAFALLWRFFPMMSGGVPKMLNRDQIVWVRYEKLPSIVELESTIVEKLTR